MTGNKYATRIPCIDGLRGVAIALVVLFHAYANRPDIVPFGDRYAQIPVFAYGWLGVQMFFLISGFVIFMTLERSDNFGNFILRRWLRLFPAMLICSIFIYITAPFLPERPAGPVGYQNLLPGLTFIEPGWWTKLLGVSVESLEGPFWSLYVEVKFYVLLGIFYFTLGWRKAVALLLTLFGLAIAVLLVKKAFPVLDLRLINKLVVFTDARYYGWFAAGALYYKYFFEPRKTYLAYAVVIGLIAALAEVEWHPRYNNIGWEPTIWAIFVVVTFTAAITSFRVQAILSHPALLFIGFISYPLYLIHDNIMVAMIIKIGCQLPQVNGFLIPLLPIALLIGASWLVAKYMEPWIRKQIRFSCDRFYSLIDVVRRLSTMPSDPK